MLRSGTLGQINGEEEEEEELEEEEEEEAEAEEEAEEEEERWSSEVSVGGAHLSSSVI